MKEIGGYLELDTYNLPLFHKKALKFNCGRNCLAYLIEEKKIRKIAIPFFICDSIKDVLKKYNIAVNYYHIGYDFLPKNIQLDDDEYLYLVNYYGQLTKKNKKTLLKKYKRVILDNTQAFFDKALKKADTIYSCRKFFGVPDGALLYTDAKIGYLKLEKDKSYMKMDFILGRFEETANSYYQNFSKNEETFEKAKVLKMSKLTENLLHAIHFKKIKRIRTINFNHLYKKLNEINKLKLHKCKGAYVYPLYIENASEIRKKLLENLIYIPILWPNILNEHAKDTIEYKLANNILPLPCDQRYTIEEMEFICRKIEEYNKSICEVQK